MINSLSNSVEYTGEVLKIRYKVTIPYLPSQPFPLFNHCSLFMAVCEWSATFSHFCYYSVEIVIFLNDKQDKKVKTEGKMRSSQHCYEPTIPGMSGTTSTQQRKRLDAVNEFIFQYVLLVIL